MGTDSYLELFTTMYGWTFANVIVRTLADTGLTVLPFLFLFISAWLEAHERGVEGGGVTWLIRKLEVTMWTGLFVYSLCVQTTSITSLSHAGLHYTPWSTSVSPAPVTATGADPQSTYGSAFDDVSEVAAVPAWWYSTMSVSAGINASVRAGIAGNMRDFRQIQDLANIATVQDPRLRQEIQRFYSECFVPARSRFLRAEDYSADTNAALQTYGQQDVDWMGSHAFLSDPAFYPTLYARQDVRGFPYDPARDTDVNPAGPLPTWGRPSCKEWWESPSVGLRARMADHVGSTGELRTKIFNVFSSASAEEVEDQLARLALTKATLSYINPDASLGDDRSEGSKALHAAPEVLGAVGTAFAGFAASATMMPLITLMTMVQPLILMGMYMFLPAVTVMSGYSLQVMVTGGLAIFTVKFWTVMWFIARWVDDHLIAAMYPGSNGNVLLEAITTGLDGSYKRTVLNILLMGMYIGLPTLWTGMMVWAGHRLDSGISAMLDSATKTAKQAGAIGGDIAKKVITKR